MDLRQMEVVVAVADTGGFTAAARRLHVVQSAVSGTVRALERELGTPLFDRTTPRVVLIRWAEVATLPDRLSRFPWRVWIIRHRM